MTIKELENNISNKVRYTDRSKVFHLVIEKESDLIRAGRTACGKADSIQKRLNGEGANEAAIDEAVDNDMRVCSHCLQNIRQLDIADVKSCTLCEDFSLLVKKEYNTIEVDKNTPGVKEVTICEDCASRIASLF